MQFRVASEAMLTVAADPRAISVRVARGLAIRHDRGSQYMSDHFQRGIAFLGIESSPVFARAPEWNGCAERFISTLKENRDPCPASNPWSTKASSSLVPAMGLLDRAPLL
jgi:transposase InsO family protein